MKKHEFNLDELLKTVRVPDRSDGYWERFPERLTKRIGEGPAETESRNVRGLSGWLALAAACLVVVLGGVVWKGLPISSASASDKEIAHSEKLYREIAAVFPGRLRAVVQEGTDVKLLLSEQSDVPQSTPLFLKICAGASCRNVVTFSGQQIQVSGEPMDVLADAQGNVIVAGRRFVWSSVTPGGTAGPYRIQARMLEDRS